MEVAAMMLAIANVAAVAAWLAWRDSVRGAIGARYTT